MRRSALLLSALLLAGASCAPASPRPFLPDGDPVAGREAFSEMRCHVCHEVVGDTFPAPHATPPVDVPLGPSLEFHTRATLAESIIAPSHVIPDWMEGVERGGRSRMGDYGEAMTVRQWLDIVAYLESLASGP